jgi:hypothetical protein
MASIEQEAARAARKAGVDPRLYIALITRGERSHRGWQTSPMGASGPAQLMPGTAANLAKKYKINTRTRFGNLLGGAYYLKEMLDTFGGDQRKAVAAYNAGPGNVQKYGGVPPFEETRRYVNNIFGALKTIRVPGEPSRGRQPPTAVSPLPLPPGMPFAPQPLPQLPGMDLHATALSNIDRIAMGERPTDVLGDLVAAARMPPPAEVIPGGQLVKPEAPPLDLRDGRGESVVKTVVAHPGGGWGGSYAPATALANVGRQFGLKSTSEKRDRQMTASGHPSDHWVGSKDSYAYDLGGSAAQMDKAAAAIARRLGLRRYRPGQSLVLTKTIGGLRYQVLYRTNVGGNHYDHIHVGVRRVK